MSSYRHAKTTKFKMDLFTLGQVPETWGEITAPAGVQIRPYQTSVPLFNVDAVLIFAGADAGARELFLRSGRPVIDFTREDFDPQLFGTVYLPRLEAKARTNYRPIDCNFYDNFEAAIVTRRVVQLIVLDPFGAEVELTTRLKDLTTRLTEEFVQLESGAWLRLDRIVRVDGVPAGESCRF